MVKYHKLQFPWRKSEVCGVIQDEESSHYFLGFFSGNSSYSKRTTRPKLLYFMFLTFLYCCIILAPHYLMTSSSTFSLFYSFGVEDVRLLLEAETNASLCSFVPNGTICCNRNSIRSDICIMKGDVSTDSKTSSVFLYRGNSFSDYVLGNTEDDDVNEVLQHEKIRPYTRKWEPFVMDTVTQLNLVVKKGSPGNSRRCDVKHNVPAVFFSTAGYTGNLYHEFNDGIIPLFITTHHLNKQVVFVIVNYRNWWMMKYGDIVSELSDYPVVDFSGDNRTHCFPEAVVGLRIHDELTVDPSLMKGNKTIRDFRNLLDRAYWPRIRGLIEDEERDQAQLNVAKLALSPSLAAPVDILKEKQALEKPKLVIISRNKSRKILHPHALVKLAEEIGFSVETVRPNRTSELAMIYRVLNASDVLVGVHGAAMTHFLFMKPGSVFIQIIPLGTDWASETYYGEPSMKLGLNYVGYKILPNESSLYDSYEKNDPVLVDPDGVNKRGWEITKEVYLDHQNVRLNLRRFEKRLLHAYYHTMSKKKGHDLRFQSR
ncbi:hypothetical protein ACH5RR_002832 [Cinchona calisaya]|uniref:Glycosyltransferase 61 catalytic domain-containing protein n=1 Tax=Cinchona calisaya TaxID=153742 RepID=A0ABD3AT50_9GENT